MVVGKPHQPRIMGAFSRGVGSGRGGGGGGLLSPLARMLRFFLRITGLHLLGRALPLGLLLALACGLPMAWAWRNFVTPSNWWTKRVIVDTESGPVQGFTQDKVSFYLGIPYAAPPVGELRFAAPRILGKKWDKRQPYDATYFRAECMQGKLHNADRPKVLSEDCLFLNIWTPSTATKKKPVPVMVWLYGGAFQQGGSSKAEYYGENLAAKGVVIVSCNYRLGALGFMVSVDDGLYGNYGLQDQRFCMEWVQRNIRGFGGDPNQVTLFGESAGAMSVGQHLMMEGQGRLFHRVIMQSNPFSYHYRSLTVANFLGQAVKKGVDCYDLKCLQEEPVEELLEVQDSIHGLPRSVGDFFTWGPVVKEGPWWRAAEVSGGRQREAVPITVRQPLKALEARDFVNKVPVILGSCKDEGHMFVYNIFPFPMPKYLYWGFIFVLFRESAPKIIRHYAEMVEKEVARQGSKRIDYRPVLSIVLNDYMFRCPTWRAAHLLQEKSVGAAAAPVYVFQFSHPTRVPGYPECHGLSCHTSELPFVFNNLDVIHKQYAMGYEDRNASTIKDLVSNVLWGLFVKADTDEKLASMMADYWVAFGTTGNPNFKGAPVHWRQWKGRRRYHLQQNPVDDDEEWREGGREEEGDLEGGSAGAARRGWKAATTGAAGGRKGGGGGGRKKGGASTTVIEPHYLELKWKPEVHLATRDCTCDFWDNFNCTYILGC